jgi:methylase of polypeptide subunit release factors
MEARLQLTKEGSEASVNATKYRSMVGALQYLIHTRPDLAHAVSYVSRFTAEPREDHLIAVKRILRYIASSHDHGVQYERRKAIDLVLLGYSDSDLAGDVDDSRSTSGILFYLGKNPIT